MTESEDGILDVLVFAAAIMAAGYAFDAAGLRIRFWLLAGLAVLAAACLRYALAFRRPRLPDVPRYLVALAMFAFALWLASPAYLPVTNGPDVVHHLQLIHVISATGRLPHDASQYPYLLEMMNYTPGSHVLASAIGAWLRMDPVFVVYPLAAGAAAIKAALLYALAQTMLGSTWRAAVQALAAPVLALVPVYFLGGFVQFFFFGQVLSEAFAVGMLFALTSWVVSPSRRHLWIASACGVGVVLSWPIWIVPCAMTAAVAALLGASRWHERGAVVAMAAGPALLFGLVHQALHPGAASIVTSTGAVTAPSIDAFGLGFLVAAAGGVVLGVRERAALPVVAFLAATLLLAAALACLAAGGGTGRFYMAFKMMYLAMLPAAVLGAVALARAADVIAMLLRNVRVRPAAAGIVSAMLPVLVAVPLLRGRVPTHRMRGSLSAPARDVALRARERVPPSCIDYFSSYWLTGYWLHLDVLANPRLSDRMRQETFDFPDVAAKWIEGRGLPYAIVEDMGAIPREIRADMSPMYQAGSFVLVRNARPAVCDAR